MNLNFDDPTFEPKGAAETLAVMLHAYMSTRDNLANAIEAVRGAYKDGGVDIYAPTLPYSHWWDPTGANQIVVKLVSDLDEIWEQHNYKRIIFIGHSLGGILVRRLFLAGAPNPPDYKGDYLVRDDLPADVTGQRHEWAAHVKRIVLLASWDKGWSISPRDAWRYSLPLNILGSWGRVAELVAELVAFWSKSGPPWWRKVAERIEFWAKPGRTMLDMRLGAPFIVQTRLLWMAYRRWHHPHLRGFYNRMTLEAPRRESGAVNPLVIQIIGAKDDFVSPQDQVDYDVEAAEQAADEAAEAEGTAQHKKKSTAQHEKEGTARCEKTYFLLEMPGADHAGVVNFNGAGGNDRKNTFITALTDYELSKSAQNPAYFEDMPAKPNPKAKDIVFVMHGIRDDGYWTHRIAEAVKRTADAVVSSQQSAVDRHELEHLEHIESWTQTYGYFPMGPFLLPWIRRQKVEWFMDKYVSVKARYPSAIMHYVGHSNGTYLAARALEDYAAARFGNIYFAGSVVHPKFDWSSKVKQGRVKKFHNARGATDWVVALLPKSLEYFADVGGAGFDGFEQASAGDPAITESRRYAKGGHSGAILEGHWDDIAKFIVNGEKPFASGEPAKLFEDDQNRWLKLVARFRIFIPFAFSIVAVLVLYFFSWSLPHEHWQWGRALIDVPRGWEIWGIALANFLVLQYCSKQAPTGAMAGLLVVLFLASVGGVANLLLGSFFADAMEFSKLDALRFSIAGHATAAVFTFVGLVALIRFILTRF